MYCESTDDKSETENTFLINLLYLEIEYETPIESNYYQNTANISNLNEPNTSQSTVNYTPHVIDTISNMNNIDQNTTNRI